MTRLSCCRRLPLSAILALGALCRIAAGEVTVIAPTEPVPIGGFADVLIQGLEKPNSLVWQAYPTEPVRVTAAWGTTDPILSVPTHKARKVALWVAWLDGDKIGHQVIELVIGQPGPEPEPDPEPEPTPPPPPPGKRMVLLIHESADSDPAFSQMTTLLRQPPHSAHLKNRLSIIDDDTVNEHGEPVLSGWMPHIAGLQMPVLVIYDAESKAIVHKQAIAKGATAAEVMALIQEHE